MKTALIKARHKVKAALTLVTLITALAFNHTPVLARCAMCKLGLSSSDGSASIINSLNLGIVVLLVPPVLIFCLIFIIAFRQVGDADCAQVQNEVNFEGTGSAVEAAKN